MELVFLICLPHILKPTLHPAVACRTPKIQNWQSAAPKRLFEIQAIPMILARFRRNSQARTIDALYGAIVAQARSVTFYADYRVPDTVEGRFDLIVLHLVLLLSRLGRSAEAWRGLGQKLLGQELFDAFCGDLDANLREMGVGDLAVPKRMQAFAEAFYGRQAAYLAALEAADQRVFEKALARNIFPAGNDAGAAQLAHYARAAVTSLDAQDDSALFRGEVVFPSPEAFVHERTST
jgi:cytochrome b pre-mRNA-processing protein 3